MEPDGPRPLEDTPSNLLKSYHSIHRKLDTNIGAHSRMKPTFVNTPLNYNTFATSLSTYTKSVALPLWPVEARAGSEQGHNLVVLVEALEVIFSSTYARRTEPFYSALMRGFNLTDLSRNPHRRFLLDPLTGYSTPLRLFGGSAVGGQWSILIQVFEHGPDQFFRRFSRSSLGLGGERAAWAWGIGTRGVGIGGGNSTTRIRFK